MAETIAPSAISAAWPVVLALSLLSAPLVLMYAYLFVDTITESPAGSLRPERVHAASTGASSGRRRRGKPNIWRGHAEHTDLRDVRRLPDRACRLLDRGLRAVAPQRARRAASSLPASWCCTPFPSVTLIIAIFLVLQMVGLYNSLIGVILVKAAIDMPLGIWLMKGFYDTVPWEIEMAGITDGAAASRVWRRLVLPQVAPGLLALGLFSFLLGVERIHPAAGAGAGQPGAGAVGLPRRR